MVSQKCLPGLRRRVPVSHHVFRDRRLGDFGAEHQQLAMDPGCAPKWVFPTHPPDQISQAAINPWPPCPMTRFPTPKHFEPTAMPTQDGLWLNHLNSIKKARPKPRHPYEKSAITAAQSKTRRCLPQSDGQLMAEKQILSLKPAPRLEQVGDEHSEGVQDCQHRSQGCDDSALRCESRPDEIFGKDRYQRAWGVEDRADTVRLTWA